MKNVVKVLLFLCFVAVPAYAQQSFIGAGLTSTSTSVYRKTGPSLEGNLHLGVVKFVNMELGTADVYAVLFPDPGSRFSVAFHPSYFKKHKAQLFVAVGGQWVNLTNADAWNSTLTVGAQVPYGFQLRVTRLYLQSQGYRYGFDYLKPIGKGLGFKVSSDLTVSRNAKDYHMLNVSIVKFW